MKNLPAVFAVADRIAFGAPQTVAERGVRGLLVLALYLIGAAHLILFFNGGDLALVAYDWIKEDAYLNALRDAQTTGVPPWTWSEAFYHSTPRLLANPEIILTPDIILLRWVPNSIFVIIHILLFYTIGFLGSLSLARRANASLVAFAFFWLVFNFNGSITAHLAVGHLQWAGYYLLPLFFALLFRIAADTRETPVFERFPMLAMGLLLGLWFLNGSFHFAIWACMFMLIAALWNRSLFKGALWSIAIGVLLGFGRVLPAALWFPDQRSFLSGYPGFSVLFDALVLMREHDHPAIGGLFGRLGWWEYDVFVGYVALFAVAVAGYAGFRSHRIRFRAPLIAAACAMALLSMGDVFAVVANSPLPFAGVERVSSRFILLPLVLIFVVAMAGLDPLFRSSPAIWKPAVLAALPLMFAELMNHSRIWQVGRLEAAVHDVAKPGLSISPTHDAAYAFSVYAGWFVSLLAMLFAFYCLVRARAAAWRAAP
ncbi:MAG: hypothetical protein KDG50_08875 [Chromatiales bacterium]|nr:hypothetical protein [Chromatiales bacterium]